jgi:hypothetical protein
MVRILYCPLKRIKMNQIAANVQIKASVGNLPGAQFSTFTAYLLIFGLIYEGIS